MDRPQALRRVLTSARRQLRLTRDDLAAEAGVGETWLGRAERGDVVPSIETILELYRALAQFNHAHSDELMTRILLAWLEDTLRTAETREADDEDRVDSQGRQHPRKRAVLATQQAALEAVKRLPRQPGINRSRTLDNFPDAFEPLVIVCGDRRESPPRSLGDLFTYSISVADLMFLSELGLDRKTRIYSDKSMISMRRSELNDAFGKKNMLIIGSPSSNIASRRVNNSSIFRFNINKNIRTFQTKLENLYQIRDPRILLNFEYICKNLGLSRGKSADKLDLSHNEFLDLVKLAEDLLGDIPVDQIPELFRGSGFIDPLERGMPEYITRSNNDFAVVSLAHHPIAPEGGFVAILAAGTKSRGTAHAIRALAEGEFAHRPLGGVLEIHLPEVGDRSTWLFEDAQRDFRTADEYTVDDVRQAFRSALTGSVASSAPLPAQLDKSELRACVRLIDQVSPRESRREPGAGFK